MKTQFVKKEHGENADPIRRKGVLGHASLVDWTTAEGV
jgi:hypothetical protein